MYRNVIHTEQCVMHCGKTIFPFCVYVVCPLQECISDYHEVPLSGKMKVTTEVIPGTEGLRPVLSPDCWPAFTEMVCGIL